MSNRVALVLVASTVLALGTGCGKIREKLAEKAAEKAIEKSSGGDVKISSGGVTMKDKNGAVLQAGTGASLPDDWPKDIPAYPGAKIQASMGTPQGKTVVFESSDAPAKVVDFYKSKLSSFSKQADVDLGGVRTVAFKDGKRSISITASQSGDKTSIQVSVATNG